METATPAVFRKDVFYDRASVRYTVYHKGIVQYEKNGSLNKEAKTVQRSYCFDYRLFADSFNINLERTSDSMPENSIEEDKVHPKPNSHSVN